MIHGDAMPAPSISPAHRSPPTVETHSPASPRAVVKALFQILSATLSFCTIAQAAPGIPVGSMEVAALKASAGISPRPLGTRTVGPTIAFTIATTTTESQAGPITIHR